MDCECTKIEDTNKTVSVDESTNDSVGVSNDAVIQQQNTGLTGVTLKQPVSIITDHSRDNKEHTVENVNPSPSDHLRKQKEFALVNDTRRDPTSVFTNNSVQTVEKNTDVVPVTTGGQAKEKMNHSIEEPATSGKTTSSTTKFIFV